MSPMSRKKPMDGMSKWTWWRLLSAHALLALLLVSGCATVQTQQSTTQATSTNVAIVRAGELARNDAALSGAMQQDNRVQIERLLAGLDNATLIREAAALPAGDPLYRFAGQALVKRGLPLPRPFDRGDWRFDTRPPADADGYRPPVKLAVLLPLSGGLSKAAVPVRDGLLAGYYGAGRRRPEVIFHDTAGTPDGAVAAYGRAVAEGADYVIGPLGRDEVGALFRTQLSVPVLALNRGSVAPPAGSISFSLAPEDDGIAAAEFLLARNLRRALVLRDASLGRAVSAFQEQFQRRGGTVAQILDVGDKPGDMTAMLQAAAQTPEGVDALFLAVKPTQAVAIAPQLAAAGLAGKARVATSQFASADDGPPDRALDGIAFPTETWDAGRVAGLPSPETAAQILPSARGGGARLFAFGHDAWLLSAYLERLATRADGSVQGATGTLRLDGFGNVVRTPAWSTFSGGVAVPLGNGAR